ncbi:MAG: alpha/beta hydrolase [Proteobacteria bacterium]|nr:alpha/beta hydrolase [Pseudomonadota bacterium]
MRPETPLDPPRTTIQLDRGALAYTDTGSGRTVIAIHGLPASSRDFRWFDAALAGRVRLIRLDLPGFGESPQHAQGGRTLRDLAEVVRDFCDAADLHDALLLGHSMGGPVALDAATSSDRIRAVALVNSAGPRLHRSIFPRAYRLVIWAADLHPWMRRLLLWVGRPVARLAGFSKHLADHELLRSARLCGGFDPSVVAAQLAALDKPLLVAWAEDDPAVQKSVSEALIACTPDCEPLRFETGGHNLQSTRATELADALAAWSDALGPTPG